MGFVFHGGHLLVLGTPYLGLFKIWDWVRFLCCSLLHRGPTWASPAWGESWSIKKKPKSRSRCGQDKTHPPSWGYPNLCELPEWARGRDSPRNWESITFMVLWPLVSSGPFGCRKVGWGLRADRQYSWPRLVGSGQYFHTQERILPITTGSVYIYFQLILDFH